MCRSAGWGWEGGVRKNESDENIEVRNQVRKNAPMPMNWLHNVPPLYVRSHHVGELQLQRIVAWVEEALLSCLGSELA